MSNTHTTQQTAPPSPLAEFRRILPSLVLTAIVAFVTSWWNNQWTLNDLRYRIDRLEEKQREAAATMSANAQQEQQNAIKLAELGITQANVVEQLKEIKQEQERALKSR